MKSQKFFCVVDAGGELVLELFLSGHLYHLILLCSVEPAVAVLAVVEVTEEPERFAQSFLLLGGLLGLSIGKQPGADAVGPGIVLGVHLGKDDLSGEVGGNTVWLRPVSVPSRSN